MSREIIFDENKVCDECGKLGAYDFMGDCNCQECYDKCDHICGVIVRNSGESGFLLHCSDKETEFITHRFRYCPVCGEAAER